MDMKPAKSAYADTFLDGADASSDGGRALEDVAFDLISSANALG
jgi:hypothetical protein